MLSFALNHMTVPSLTMKEACVLARALGMTGVELRNDLDAPLFDGQSPDTGLTGGIAIHAVAEVKAFNAFDTDVLDAAIALMDIAVACGAPAIALIPKVGSAPVPAGDLRRAMLALAPELSQRGLVGLIEPIGFENSSLRYKETVVDLINDLDVGAHFGLIHDTFHHYLSQETAMFPAHTKLVHISGVTDHTIARSDIRDHHRVLVDGSDRLGNVAQIKELLREGYSGPLSFESFSPDVHADIDRKGALSRSINFIEDAVVALAA